MRSRWGMLAVLFMVRLTMAFQFQSVAAVAPLLERQLGVGLADIGILIGLYFTPGVALSLPGGAIGKKIGDKATVLLALLLMLAGTLAMALSNQWGVQIAGRLISGAGGVLLSVLLTKMLTDWFDGKEIATAMAIFVNSWPTGIALSLLILPSIGATYSVNAVHLTIAASIVIGIVLFSATYRMPPSKATGSAAGSGRLDPITIGAVIAAGLIWGLFNVAFVMTFSFGPTLLVERNWSITSAGSTISIVMWIAVVAVPLGGLLADRIRRPQTILIAGCLASAALMLSLPRSTDTIPILIGIGLMSSLPAGSIMSLPAKVLDPANRAIGMGIFYTVFYGAMMLGPAIGGACAKWSGSVGSAFDFGAAMLVMCPLILWVFNRTAAMRT